LKDTASVTIKVPDSHTKLLVVLQGRVSLDDDISANEAEVAMFERNGNQLNLSAVGDVTALLLTGEPLGEPIVGYGPFVMNAEEEIHRAIADFQNGRLGQLS
jgi:redox-sensitive bicupin YhaK (pirin superfamily)